MQTGNTSQLGWLVGCFVLLGITLVLVIGCQPIALTPQTAPPTATLVPVQNTALPTAPPTTFQPTALSPTTTVKPTPLSPTVSSSVTITPTEQSLPAGASTTFFVSAAKGTSGQPAVRWSVAGLPAGMTTEFMPDANPASSTLVVSTTCALPRGSYSIDVQATISQTTQIVKAKVNIAERLTESSGGSFTGSFTANTISVRRGGPSTEQSGPFLLLRFCDSAEARRLNIRVQSATSDAGTPMSAPPRFVLFKSLVSPAPDYLQTISGGYRANAREVANSDGWNLNWTIAGGVYVLAFLRSPFENSNSPEKRPASVTYNVNIDH